MKKRKFENCEENLKNGRAVVVIIIIFDSHM